MSTAMTNWAGNHTYAAGRLERPTSTEQLQQLVAGATRVRALGSRHSFTDIGDTSGTLVATDGLPLDPVLDQGARTVTFGAGARYGDIGSWLQERGWALPNLASLPHISVAGAVATGTHGSGDANRSLAAQVAALDLVGPDGELRHVVRGDADFDGSVVSMGALGIATRITLDVEPTYDVRQDIYLEIPWDATLSVFDGVMGSAYSVSLVTPFTGDTIPKVWLKSRGTTPPADLLGARRATTPMTMQEGSDLQAMTPQLGVPGPWLDRLPHFRLEHTPSRGDELQTEYLVPRSSAVEAIRAVRELGAHLAPVLVGGEIRTVAADPLWLSAAYRTDVVGLHFTWLRDPAGVYAVLPALERVLLPFGARPHWGKCFVAGVEQLAPLYPRLDDFRALRDRVDPDGTFGNAFLDRVLGPR
ncbi:D-arabinono-1,4-lactone oxidase [Lapillicoccus sp.]|uniref:D-arabinono-1,4-lactone oxidase n=1 Tax=Lapillicoccus sp. TaxID=1909287 RepID=UPI0025D661C9|nr:D-arabinono-1,4-lactone oxidase [Lapillicoccus sp.]